MFLVEKWGTSLNHLDNVEGRFGGVVDASSSNHYQQISPLVSISKSLPPPPPYHLSASSSDQAQSPSSSCKYLIWIPYESLMVVNARHVVHMKSNGELVNKVKVSRAKEYGRDHNKNGGSSATTKDLRRVSEDGSYVSARLSESMEQKQIQEENETQGRDEQYSKSRGSVGQQDSPHPKGTTVNPQSSLPISLTELERIPKLNIAIIISLSELHSIEVNQKMYGWSSIKMKQVLNANAPIAGASSSTHEKKKSWGPLIFQDGGLQTFLDQLECHMQFYRMPHNNTIFLKEKSHSLDKSVRLMEFDDYFSDVLREEGAISGMTSSAHSARSGSGERGGGLMEWGAKLSKEVNNLQVGLKRYFGGGHKEQQTKEALERIRAERQRNRGANGSSIDQKIILNPHEEENAEEIGLNDDDDGFEIIDPVKENLVPPEWYSDTSKAISLSEWHEKWMDAKTGEVKNAVQLKKDIFYRGIEEEARAEIWPFLLGFYPWNSTREEREQFLSDSADEYKVYRTQWESITPRQLEKHSVFRERSHRVEKDVVRTDRTNPLYASDDSPYLQIIYRVLVTYAFYNYDLGYCQGMGDFLSPLLSVVRDETLTYWCYSTLMDSRVHQNFHKDSKGMEAQLQSLLNIVKTLDYGLYVYLESREALNLFFCFRWILVNFKREFNYDDIKRIWESFWTNEWGENMHLFMCYAILHQHRDTFIQNQMGFDEILQFCVDLNMKMDAKQVMTKTMFAILEYKRLQMGQQQVLSGDEQGENSQQ
eukprot:CAMPEP_0117449010 /NCGR_PEP_ID=MMETSP0759-20121206/7709_1 /TAXON_ID=63605 /ORGANISM="Percolomonas cosmopolitus, Strain WS" /LENGTH=762 /DNA_ID=CAMNT_0005241441 /DNA_START=777 /DNA_END=3065 /DNA_ORIENTATION=+